MRPVSSLDLAEDLVQLLLWSSIVWGLMRKFALNPPCPRAPLAPGQVADPTSIKRGEDFPEEWAKRQAKLARQAKEAVKKFNEDSATATATEASVKPRKSMPI